MGTGISVTLLPAIRTLFFLLGVSCTALLYVSSSSHDCYLLDACFFPEEETEGHL